MRRRHSLLFTFFLLLSTPLIAQKQEETNRESRTICFYYRTVSKDSILVRIVQDGFVENERMSRNLLLTLPSRNQLFIDYYGLPSRDKNKTEVFLFEDIKLHIGNHFSKVSKEKLGSIIGYRNLLDVILSQPQTLFRSVKLNSFGIPDLVYVFNFDLVPANDSLFRDPNTPEAVALYNFMTKQWVAETAQPDYSRKLRLTKFDGYLTQDFVRSLLRTPERARLSNTDQKAIQSGKEQSLYALFGVGVVFLFCLILLFNFSLYKRNQRRTIERIEGKIRNMDKKLEKPFYQTPDIESGQNERLQRMIEEMAIRLKRLELDLPAGTSTEYDFKHDTAKKAYTLIQDTKMSWNKTPPTPEQHKVIRLSVLMDEFTSTLSSLDHGFTLQGFTTQSVIPFIDRLDSVFQDDVDSSINTPKEVQAFVISLTELFGIRIMEIIPKVTLFNNEIHERAGAILKTTYPQNTILKVLQRGMVVGSYVRPARVVKAE